MTHKDFAKLLQRRLDKTRQVLDTKSKEYSTPLDKLHNFKMAAQMRPAIDGVRSVTIPTDSLQGMLDKHLVSYFDMLDSVRLGLPITQIQVDEKLGDIINYFILQEALFVEYINDNE